VERWAQLAGQPASLAEQRRAELSRAEPSRAEHFKIKINIYSL